MDAAPLTHHVWWDEPNRRRAICGAIIGRKDSVPEPTCPRCREILARHDAAKVAEATTRTEGA